MPSETECERCGTPKVAVPDLDGGRFLVCPNPNCPVDNPNFKVKSDDTE